MSHEQELYTAQLIRDHEAAMLASLARITGVPEVEAALSAKEGRTHGSVVEAHRVAIVVLRGRQRSNRHGRAAQAAWDAAERARWALAMSCHHIARKEAQKRAVLMGEDDLEQEGLVGLYKAAVRFDPDRRLRFGTYAKWWVRMAITRAIDQRGREVKLSSTAVEQRRNLNKLITALDRRGEAYTHQSLADWMGWQPDAVRDLLAVLVEPVPIVHSHSGHDSDASRYLGEVLVDEPDIEGGVQRTQDNRWLWWALAQLNYRHRLVLRMMWGIDRTGRSHTLQEVGHVIGVTRERVRQIGNVAMRLLSELPRGGRRWCPPCGDVGLGPLEMYVLDLIWCGDHHCVSLSLATGASRHRVSDAINTLVASGMISRENSRFYAITGSPGCSAVRGRP